MSQNPKALLDSYDILPKKSLGQNFMHDPNALEKIVASAELQSTDTVVEVGAGTGGLTAHLAEAAGRSSRSRSTGVCGRFSKNALRMLPMFTSYSTTFLKTDIAALVGADDYIVVANVPYYISSAILWHFLESRRPPKRAW